MIKFISIMILLCVGFNTYPLTAHNHISQDQLTAVETLIQNRMSIDDIPGVSVVLVENGKILEILSYGHMGPSLEPVTPLTLFGLGSLSKSFTGIAVLQMIEEGLINFDDPIVKHLPWFRTKNSRRSNKITIRQLLNHTSGFSSYDGNTLLADQEQAPKALERAVRRLENINLGAEPGTTFSYNNDNYRILGVLIEKLTGMSYESVIQQRIFNPLHMNTARFFGIGEPNVATPHRYWLNTPIAHQIPLGSSNNPETGVYASGLDMANYLIALTGGNESIPNFWRKSLAEGPTLGSGNRYSIGLESHGSLEKPILLHGGWNSGFMARIGFDPVRRFGVVIMTNISRGYIKGDIDKMTKGVLSLIVNSDESSPKSFLEERIVLGTLMTLTFSILCWAIIFVRWTYSIQHGQSAFRGQTIITTLLPSIPLLALVWVSLITVPRTFETTISGIQLFHPDLGWLLTCFAILCTSLALCRPIFIFQTKYHNHHRSKF